MDWLPKYDNPLDYIGTLLLIFGIILVLAGFGVVSVKQISIRRGTKTWIMGICVFLIGVGFLLPHIVLALQSQTTATPSTSIPLPSEAPPQATTPAAAITLPPSTPPPQATPDVKTPEGFLHYYFYLVTQGEDYELAWSLLTPKFQKVNDPGGYEEYVGFWKTIKQVDLNKVEIEPLSNTSVNCLVDITFLTMSGITDNETLNYRLIYNASRKIWMFDSP